MATPEIPIMSEAILRKDSFFLSQMAKDTVMITGLIATAKLPNPADTSPMATINKPKYSEIFNNP